MSQTNPFTALLAAQPYVLLDGAMATELEARGCDLADSLWSAKVLLEKPFWMRAPTCWPVKPCRHLLRSRR